MTLNDLMLSQLSVNTSEATSMASLSEAAAAAGALVSQAQTSPIDHTDPQGNIHNNSVICEIFLCFNGDIRSCVYPSIFIICV